MRIRVVQLPKYESVRLADGTHVVSRHVIRDPATYRLVQDQDSITYAHALREGREMTHLAFVRLYGREGAGYPRTGAWDERVRGCPVEFGR